jgi:cold shock CspA family protein
MISGSDQVAPVACIRLDARTVSLNFAFANVIGGGLNIAGFLSRDKLVWTFVITSAMTFVVMVALAVVQATSKPPEESSGDRVGLLEKEAELQHHHQMLTGSIATHSSTHKIIATPESSPANSPRALLARALPLTASPFASPVGGLRRALPGKAGLKQGSPLAPLRSIGGTSKNAPMSKLKKLAEMQASRIVGKAVDKPKESVLAVAEFDPFAEAAVAEFDPFAEANDAQILSPGAPTRRFKQELQEVDVRASAKKKAELALELQEADAHAQRKAELALELQEADARAQKKAELAREKKAELAQLARSKRRRLTEDEEQNLALTSTARTGNLFGLRHMFPLPIGSSLPLVVMPCDYKSGKMETFRKVLDVHNFVPSVTDTVSIIGKVCKIFKKKYGFLSCLGKQEIFFHLRQLQGDATVSMHTVVRFRVGFDLHARRQTATAIEVLPSTEEILQGAIIHFDERKGFGFVRPNIEKVEQMDTVGYEPQQRAEPFLFLNQDVHRNYDTADMFVIKPLDHLYKGRKVEFTKGMYLTPLSSRPRAHMLVLQEGSVPVEEMSRATNGNCDSSTSSSGGSNGAPGRIHRLSRLSWNDNPRPQDVAKQGLRYQAHDRQARGPSANQGFASGRLNRQVRDDQVHDRLSNQRTEGQRPDVQHRGGPPRNSPPRTENTWRRNTGTPTGGLEPMKQAIAKAKSVVLAQKAQGRFLDELLK